MNIEFYQALIQSLSRTHTKLIAVSKTRSNDALMEAYQLGIRAFGENKVQELVAKQEALPKDIEWHLIGHLQSNKVKYIAPFIYLIHSIDSLSLLEEVNKQAEKNNRIIRCLLQCHIAKEETKYGFSAAALETVLSNGTLTAYKHIELCGLMGMATNTDDAMLIEQEFASLQQLFLAIKSNYFSAQDSFKELLMGMSGDYEMAIKHGSTMVRIGSSLFGERS